MPCSSAVVVLGTTRSPSCRTMPSDASRSPTVPARVTIVLAWPSTETVTSRRGCVPPSTCATTPTSAAPHATTSAVTMSRRRSRSARRWCAIAGRFGRSWAYASGTGSGSSSAPSSSGVGRGGGGGSARPGGRRAPARRRGRDEVADAARRAGAGRREIGAAPASARRAGGSAGIGGRRRGRAGRRRRRRPRPAARRRGTRQHPGEERVLVLGGAPEVGLELGELAVEVDAALLDLEQLELAREVERGELRGEVDRQPRVRLGRLLAGRRRLHRAQRIAPRACVDAREPRVADESDAR